MNSQFSHSRRSHKKDHLSSPPLTLLEKKDHDMNRVSNTIPTTIFSYHQETNLVNLKGKPISSRHLHQEHYRVMN